MNRELFDKEIKRITDDQIDLNGKNVNSEVIQREFSSLYPDENPLEVLYAVEKEVDILIKLSKRYGVIMGRFQPFTLGHQSIVNDIILDGRIPIIILGSSNVTDDKNPFSYNERVELIRKVYPFGCKFIKSNDYENWDLWFEEIENNLDYMANRNQIKFYSHSKDIDKYSTIYFKDKVYKDVNYIDIFKDEGYEVKDLDEFKGLDGNTIHASDIRRSEEIAKRNLDARIYMHIKKKYNFY